MAEGHAVARWARELRRLIGEPLESIEAPRRWTNRVGGLRGAHLISVETRGKHLLLRLSDGSMIHCHAMMYGSWQVGERGMTCRKAGRHVRLGLRTVRHEAVFFHGPVVEILRADELSAHPSLSTLGPDVMSPGFDREEAWRRLQEEPARAIGDVLLDQRAVAGSETSSRRRAFSWRGSIRDDRCAR